MDIIIDDSIRTMMADCRLGYTVIENVAIKGTPAALSQELLQLQDDIGQAYDLDLLGQVPRIVAVRNMYRKLRFDPARYRPASEALIRRVLQHKNLYYVNSAVDVNNYCSLKYLLPFGLYDADKIAGGVAYRVAPAGTYLNIAGNEVSTDGKPFLCDGQGVFGNPTSDARRTAVTLTTRSLLSVIYPDEEVDAAELADMLRFTADMLIRYNGGRIVTQTIVSAKQPE
jgi:DNA/RNA-binding domain of Phe-tRNA-synthetase-like protein